MTVLLEMTYLYSYTILDFITFSLTHSLILLLSFSSTLSHNIKIAFSISLGVSFPLHLTASVATSSSSSSSFTQLIYTTASPPLNTYSNDIISSHFPLISPALAALLYTSASIVPTSWEQRTKSSTYRAGSREKTRTET